MGAVAAGLALTTEGLYKGGKFLGESLGRAFGISARSQAALSIILAKCGNFFGFADPENLAEKIRTVKAPVRSWMNACDCVGTAVTVTLAGVLTVASAALAFVGLSKSNYHRFCYYKNQISNSLAERRGMRINDFQEHWHRSMLEDSQKTTMGNFFSHVNILNLSAQVLYRAARFIVAPTIYASVRLLANFIPASIRALGRCLYPRNLDDLNDPITRARKCFADLNEALDQNGELSWNKKGEISEEAWKKAEERDQSFFKRAGFTLFSEGRRIFSLGYTPEEKILYEFEDKFEQFVNARKRAERKGQDVPPVSDFLKKDVKLPNGKRFSYEHMVSRVTGFFKTEDEIKAINNIAELVNDQIIHQITDSDFDSESGPVSPKAPR